MTLNGAAIRAGFLLVVGVGSSDEFSQAQRTIAPLMASLCWDAARPTLTRFPELVHASP